MSGQERGNHARTQGEVTRETAPLGPAIVSGTVALEGGVPVLATTPRGEGLACVPVYRHGGVARSRRGHGCEPRRPVNSRDWYFSTGMKNPW